MNGDEEVVNNDARRTLVRIKREIEIAQNTVEAALHQLVRRLDAHISAKTRTLRQADMSTGYDEGDYHD